MNNQIIIKNSSNVILDNWIKSDNGKYCILTNNDYFTINTTNNINCELVMIGGGGAGGYFYGGGGGAGCVYYDNNFILNSENKYKFNIGTGGKSILNNIDDIFKNGLELQGFYNSKPNIDNFNITDEDISSLLNINCKNNVLCPYIKNIVNLNSLSEATNNVIDITKNGYSLMWNGFLSVPVDGNYIFELNTKFLTYIWIDMYMTEYNKDNLFIQTGIDGINKRYFKELKAGVYYNFKMLVFNGNNTNSFSFTMKNEKSNINTENNTFKNYIFSLNKDVKENYENKKSTPTTLSIDDKIAIKCDGGGIGGYGLNINDKININGGSGGGAGINKIAGISTIIKNENYYGFNGSAGNDVNKCGGGGGSYSGGYDSTGGHGIEINWLNDTIGVGGNGYILNEYKIPVKNNKFGSGGNGGGVFDKEFKLCGKSGTNGCAIIFIKNNIQNNNQIINEDNIKTTDDIEHFANPKAKNNIFDEYIEKSYIKGNVFSNKLNLVEIDDKLLPCNDNNLIKLYSDCLCYLNLYSSLFIELQKMNKNNNYEITKFKESIQNLKIKFDISGSTTGDTKISKFEDNIFTLYYNRLNTAITIISTSNYTTITGTDDEYKPILSNIYNTFDLDLVEPTLSANFASYFPVNLTSLKNLKEKLKLLNDDKFPVFNNVARYFKFYNVLYEILSTPAENIMGYLLYYKIFYNIIVYNLSIQLTFRKQIVNNTNFASGEGSIITSEANLVKNHINNMKENIKNLNLLTFPDPKDNEYLKDKAVYSSKIELLNNIKAEYNNNQILLNRAIKNYNDYFKNYEKLKTNALFAIIFLVVLIVVSVIIFASNFDSSFKQTYNMVANVFLIITTFFYYNNFKDVTIFENFATGGAFSCDNAAGIIYESSKDNLFNNYLNEPINSYNSEIKEIFNKLRTNMLTTGSKSYSTDGNKYLYNLYLEKKQKNEIYKTKRVNITNLIEVLKKQISFLFNIILLICFVSIIAFFSLFMFNLIPQMLTFIIIIASIFMLIICVYFIFAIMQPTRLGANKNYWANETPDQSYLAKL